MIFKIILTILFVISFILMFFAARYRFLLFFKHKEILPFNINKFKKNRKLNEADLIIVQRIKFIEILLIIMTIIDVIFLIMWVLY